MNAQYVSKNDEGKHIFDYDLLGMSDRVNFLTDIEQWAATDMGSVDVNWTECATESDARALAAQYFEYFADGLYAEDEDGEEVDVEVDPATREMVIDAYVAWWRNKRAEYELQQVMTPSEVAAEFGVHRQTVHDAIERGVLPARQSGTVWLVRRADAAARWDKYHVLMRGAAGFNDEVFVGSKEDCEEYVKTLDEPWEIYRVSKSPAPAQVYVDRTDLPDESDPIFRD